LTGNPSGAASATGVAALRLAEERDIPALEALIARSARALQAATYAPAQIEAALGTVFAVDTQLIADGTYYVALRADQIVGCGGWSRRRTLFGGHGAASARDDSVLDPTRDPARIRAFFVHPNHARQGIGRLLLCACERAAIAARFRRLELVATLAGEPLYLACGFRAVERYHVTLHDGSSLPVVRMDKTPTIAVPASAAAGR
jgi:GNAT superfamily N-acetyltransferase